MKRKQLMPKPVYMAFKTEHYELLKKKLAEMSKHGCCNLCNCLACGALQLYREVFGEEPKGDK
jgi:hypothetical protein